MDTQRTMDFILENLAAVSTRLEKMAERQSRLEDRQSELAAELTERLLQSDERHEKHMFEIRDELRRAIRYSVEEHRRERVRRHALEEEMKQRHLEHEEGIKELRKSMQKWLERGGNGHQPS